MCLIICFYTCKQILRIPRFFLCLYINSYTVGWKVLCKITFKLWKWGRCEWENILLPYCLFFFSTHLTLIFFDFKFCLTLNMKTKWFFNTPILSRHYNDTNLNGQISYTNFWKTINDNDLLLDNLHVQIMFLLTCIRNYRIDTFYSESTYLLILF